MKAFAFRSSGSAYNETQCNDALAENGIALVIEAEGIVGMSDTWPVAVTANFGELHSLKGTPDTYFHDYGSKAGTRVFSDDACAHALGRALDLGLELDAAFAGYADAARALEPLEPAPAIATTYAEWEA